MSPALRSRPKPPRLTDNSNWDYQARHPEVFTIFGSFYRPREWIVERRGMLVGRFRTHAEATEFVRGEIAHIEAERIRAVEGQP